MRWMFFVGGEWGRKSGEEGAQTTCSISCFVENCKSTVKTGMTINLSMLLNSDGSHCNEFSREQSLSLTYIFLIWDSAF